MGLELAQATGLIGTSVLWQGQMVTLVGVNGANAYIETSNSSSVVTLAELELAEASSRVIPTGHFNTPGVFRPQHAEICSADAPEVDPSLNACFDPSNPENLDEILRQAASSDPTQRAEGRAALRAAARQARAEGREADFNRRVQEALDQIGQEDLCESLNAQQAYSEVQATLPPASSANASNGANNSETPAPKSGSGNGAPVVVSSSGAGSIPLGFGRTEGVTTDGVFPVSLAANSSVVVSSDGTVVLATRSVPGEADDSTNDASALPAVVPLSSLPAVLTPFRVEVPVLLSSASVAALDAPRSPNTDWEAGFFQNFFGPQMTSHPSSALVSLLTNPTPEFAPKVYEVRRAVADVIREYRATYGNLLSNPLDRNARFTLNFRYDPERRRIAVSLDPMGGNRTSATVTASSTPVDDVESSPFDRFRGPFRSMALFRIGSDDHLRRQDFGPIVAFVPVPQHYFQNLRLGEGMLIARSDGRATERGIERPARRDSANDQHGGSHSGDGERRDSRGGRGGRHQRQQDDETLYASADEDFDSVAA